jgi:hypothetical protein
MKKILGTTLVAVAFAMVNTVDAKVMKKRVEMKGKSEVFAASKDTQENPTATNKNELVATLNEEANTEAKQETIDYTIRKQQLEDGIKLIKDRMKDLNYRWFAFWTDSDQKKAYQAAADRLHDLEKELNDVKVQLNENKKETGSMWTSAVDIAIKTMKYVGIPVIVIGGVSYDLYYNLGYTKGAMAEIRAGFPRTRHALYHGALSNVPMEETAAVTQPTSTTEKKSRIQQLQEWHRKKMMPKN